MIARRALCLATLRRVQRAHRDERFAMDATLAGAADGRGRNRRRDRQGASLRSRGHAETAIAAARLIAISVRVLDERIGFALAAQGFVEGGKRCP